MTTLGWLICFRPFFGPEPRAGFQPDSDHG